MMIPPPINDPISRLALSIARLEQRLSRLESAESAAPVISGGPTYVPNAHDLWALMGSALDVPIVPLTDNAQTLGAEGLAMSELHEYRNYMVAGAAPGTPSAGEVAEYLDSNAMKHLIMPSGFDINQVIATYIPFAVTTNVGSAAERDLINIAYPANAIGTHGSIFGLLHGYGYNQSASSRTVTLRFYWGATLVLATAAITVASGRMLKWRLYSSVPYAGVASSFPNGQFVYHVAVPGTGGATTDIMNGNIDTTDDQTTPLNWRVTVQFSATDVFPTTFSVGTAGGVNILSPV